MGWTGFVRYRFTRIGIQCLLIAVFAIVGGALRGFNLMLILAGLLVAAMLISWRIARGCLRSTVVQRRLPGEAFAGKPIRIRYLMTNELTRLPLWMMRIEDVVESNQVAPVTSVCRASFVPAKQTIGLSVTMVIGQRGEYRFGPLMAATRFPISMLDCRMTQNETESLLVYPQLFTLNSRWRRRLKSQLGGASTSERRQGNNEGEFFGIRNWHHGDSVRWIHWRTTARQQELAVRQFEQHRRFEVCILLDAYASPDQISPANDSDVEESNGETSLDDPFEAAVSLTASLVTAIGDTVGDRVVLAISAESSTVVSDAVGRSVARLMEPLARVEPIDEPCLGETIQNLNEIKLRPKDLVIISQRSQDQALLSDPALVAALSPWVRRRSLQWIDVTTDLGLWTQSEDLGHHPRAGSTTQSAL